MLHRNTDIIATTASAGVLLALAAPWPLWIAWTGIAAYAAATRFGRRHAQA